MEEKIKVLETKIRELFIKENMEFCTDRFLNTTKAVTKPSLEAYHDALVLRLKQGGIIVD